MKKFIMSYKKFKEKFNKSIVEGDYRTFNGTEISDYMFVAIAIENGKIIYKAHDQKKDYALKGLNSIINLSMYGKAQRVIKNKVESISLTKEQIMNNLIKKSCTSLQNSSKNLF